MVRKTDEDRALIRANPGAWMSWQWMIGRCRVKAPYGRLGIKVHPRWRSFPAFLSDMGERPDGLSIERINPAGDYRPGNCYWATTGEQAANKLKTLPLIERGNSRHAPKRWRRITRLIDHDMTIGELCDGLPDLAPHALY